MLSAATSLSSAQAAAVPPLLDICFSQEEAKGIIYKLELCENDRKLVQAMHLEMKGDIASGDQVIVKQSQQLTLLGEQLASCNARAEDLKEEYAKTSDELTECRKDTPSRWTWFSWGAGSGLLLSLLLVAL